MRGPLHALLGTRLVGMALTFWIAVLVAGLLAVLAGGVTTQLGGLAGVVGLLAVGAAIVLFGAIFLDRH